MNGTLPAWAKITGQIGIPAAVAFFLLAMLSGLIPSPILEVQKQIADMQQKQIWLIEINKVTNVETLNLLRGYTDTHMRILRAVCRNQAKSDVAISECDR